MCLILFSWNPNATDRLTVAANRDEFYDRPSRAAHFWEDNGQLLAGKDLQQNGTWLGVTRSGKFTAVTNFRKPDKKRYPLSRGELTTNFLSSDVSPEKYLQQLQHVEEQYAGFNLLVGDRSSLFYFSNRSEQPPQKLGSGVYGLSNHLLNTHWPKVVTGLADFKRIIQDKFEDSSDKEKALLKLLQNDTQADDSLLPDTGVGAMTEKLLSPLFIKSPSYGTRASTVVQIKNSGDISFLEQNYDTGGGLSEKVTFRL